MAVRKFVFNDVDSSNMGIYISGDKTFNSAEKEYEKVSVPGRSGDLLLFSNRYKNVELTYHAIVFSDQNLSEASYQSLTDDIRSWLLSANGYCKLSDDYHPNEYRMAMFAGPIEFDTYLLEAGELDITFDCMPQRWLTSGDVESTEFEGSGSFAKTITNPTAFASKPILKITGNGYFAIDDAIIQLKDLEANEEVVIDCDTQNCYKMSGSATVNKNQNIVVSKWPALKGGANTLTINSAPAGETSAITKFKLTPRWWKL